jgi:ATP-dependent Lon protease
MDLDEKLVQFFTGKVVKKDVTKRIKEGQNVPIYVLEYLLGQFCASNDEATIQAGIDQVKTILAENYVRPDEAEKVKSKIKEKGTYTVIDQVKVKLNDKKDMYIAEFSNLGLKHVFVDPDYVKQYEKLLMGGIWSILQLQYQFNDEEKDISPFHIRSLKPIQSYAFDLPELLNARTQFTTSEWIDALIRSIGLEPARLEDRVKWHMLERLVPLVENNYNLCELGPRSTGKSHVYKEVSPNSILISGGQTTVANLFVNMSTNAIGLVGVWDVVAFDEVAGINFKDKDGIQIMKDYMNSGSFSRGREMKVATASMVFVGNINQGIDYLLKTSNLFSPFPEAINNDTAFFDRIHYYLPGWEVPKFKPEHFTNDYGFIVDYISEFFREMRKRQFSDHLFKYFKLGNNLNQRDATAVKKTFSGLMKLIFPHELYSKEEAEIVLKYALEGRRRVKEQLKRIGGMEFYDVQFSYIDEETMKENYVTVLERGSNKLIPEGLNNAGTVYSVGSGNSGMLGVFKLETQVVRGTGRFDKAGTGGNGKARESLEIAFNYFKAQAKSISGNISTKEKDYHVQLQDLQGIGVNDNLALQAFVACASGALEKPLQEQMVVLGNMSIGGTISKLDNLADILQVCNDAGAKKILLPMSSASEIQNVPPELFSKFQITFYQDPIDAVYKALGVS